MKKILYLSLVSTALMIMSNKSTAACDPADQSVSFAEIKQGGFQGPCYPGNPYNVWTYVTSSGSGVVNRGTRNSDFSIGWDTQGQGGHGEFDISVNMDGWTAKNYGYSTTPVSTITRNSSFNQYRLTSTGRWSNSPNGAAHQGKRHVQNIIWLSRTLTNNFENSARNCDDNNRKTIDITTVQWIEPYLRTDYNLVKDLEEFNNSTQARWPAGVSKKTVYRGSFTDAPVSGKPVGMTYDMYRRTPGDECELTSYIMVPRSNRPYTNSYPGYAEVNMWKVLKAVDQDMKEAANARETNYLPASIASWRVWQTGWEVAGASKDANPRSRDSRGTFTFDCYSIPSLNGLAHPARDCNAAVEEVNKWNATVRPATGLGAPPCTAVGNSTAQAQAHYAQHCGTLQRRDCDAIGGKVFCSSTPITTRSALPVTAGFGLRYFNGSSSNTSTNTSSNQSTNTNSSTVNTSNSTSSSTPQVCTVVGNNFAAAVASYNQYCSTLPRKDCDPAAGKYYCSSKAFSGVPTVTAGPGIVTSTATSPSTSQTSASNTTRKRAMNNAMNALKAYKAAHGTYKVPGTAWKGNGSGWFFYDGGSAYPLSTANGLARAGYPITQKDPLHVSSKRLAGDYLIYHCKNRVGLFSKHGTSQEQTSSSDLNWWNSNGCPRHPITTMKANYFILSN